MYEIRLFSLNDARVHRLPCRQPQSLHIQRGRVWLTQAGQPQDIWLSPGQSFDLQTGQVYFISAERQAEFSLRYAIHALSPQPGWAGLTALLRRLQNRAQTKQNGQNGSSAPACAMKRDALAHPLAHPLAYPRGSPLGAPLGSAIGASL